MKVEREKFLQEDDVVNCVEGLGDVGCGDDGAKGGFPLVEPLSNLCGEGEEGSNSGVMRGEAMLGWGASKVRE